MVPQNPRNVTSPQPMPSSCSESVHQTESPWMTADTPHYASDSNPVLTADAAETTAGNFPDFSP
jgi:hypothetical protein